MELMQTSEGFRSRLPDVRSVLLFKFMSLLSNSCETSSLSWGGTYALFD